MGFIDFDPFFRRHRWFIPILWIIAFLWIAYWASYPMFYLARVTWGYFFVLLKWWWAVAKTLYVLAGQLLITVPATVLTYFIASYAVRFILSAVEYVLELLDKQLTAAEFRPSCSRTYSHTHSNGRTYTHTHGPDEGAGEEGYEFRSEHAPLIRAILESKLRQKREAEDRQRNRSHEATGSGIGGKSKHKGKKRRS